MGLLGMDLWEFFWPLRAIAWSGSLSGEIRKTMRKATRRFRGFMPSVPGDCSAEDWEESVQKLGFVPEAQNDMIFSIICEELGLFGAGIILLLFLILIWRFYVTASRAEDLFGALIASGAMAHMMIQVILNISVVTNTIPNTGITLPLSATAVLPWYFC